MPRKKSPNRGATQLTLDAPAEAIAPLRDAALLELPVWNSPFSGCSRLSARTRSAKAC